MTMLNYFYLTGGDAISSLAVSDFLRALSFIVVAYLTYDISSIRFFLFCVCFIFISLTLSLSLLPSLRRCVCLRLVSWPKKKTDQRACRVSFHIYAYITACLPALPVSASWQAVGVEIFSTSSIWLRRAPVRPVQYGVYGTREIKISCTCVKKNYYST